MLACPSTEGLAMTRGRCVRIGVVDIEANIREVQRRIEGACKRSGRSPDEVTLVAITKGFEIQSIRAAFDAGIRNFGENRVQEAERKIAQLSVLRPAVAWHMVGHLQSNKAKLAIELFDIIHSVDSLRLAEILNRRVEKIFPIFLEVNVSGEDAKSAP